MVEQLKSYTKTFVKRTKDKKEENPFILKILHFQKEGRLNIGTKVTEKNCRNSNVECIFVAKNCEEMSFKKLEYYSKLLKIDFVKLDIDNRELSQKLKKPFLVSVLSVLKNKK